MPSENVIRWNTPGLKWDSGLRWGQTIQGTDNLSQPPQTPTNTSHTTMEFWEITKDRSQKTLVVWEQHVPSLHIGTATSTTLDAFITGFDPLVAARIDAQDTFDGAFRAVQNSLATMRVLGTKVPQIIEGQLDENKSIISDVKDLYANSPRTESTILKRLRELLPVWVRANTALAALTPSQPPIVRVVGGVAFTAATAKTLYDGYTDLVGTRGEKAGLLDKATEALKAHDAAADDLNKRWYKVVKATADPGTALANALETIPTEEGTPAPVIVDISTVTQGGDDGLQALVEWAPGGGEHATTSNLRWKVEGVDADFTHSVPFNRAGNQIGPFLVGQIVRMIGEFINSTGTRTTAIRSLTIGEPIV